MRDAAALTLVESAIKALDPRDGLERMQRVKSTAALTSREPEETDASIQQIDLVESLSSGSDLDSVGLTLDASGKISVHDRYKLQHDAKSGRNVLNPLTALFRAVHDQNLSIAEPPKRDAQHNILSGIEEVVIFGSLRQSQAAEVDEHWYFSEVSSLPLAVLYSHPDGKQPNLCHADYSSFSEYRAFGDFILPSNVQGATRNRHSPKFSITGFGVAQ